MPPTHPIAHLAQFESGHYRPATFLQRGVAIPFTTPRLLGGRIRPGARSGAELVLGNPAGEDGVYILPWPALPDICTPTRHDRALWDRIAGLQVPAPRTIRDVARGIAGRPGGLPAADRRPAEAPGRQPPAGGARLSRQLPDGGAAAHAGAGRTARRRRAGAGCGGGGDGDRGTADAGAGCGGAPAGRHRALRPAIQGMATRLAAMLPPSDTPGALQRIDLARCIEIIAGPKAAAAALAKG